jgi:hypothetical protein
MIPRSPDGRWLAAGVLIVYGLFFWLAAKSWGIEPALRTAGVPSVGTPFSDLYVFSAASTEFGHGGNPYLSNPSDPWTRTYNYPRAWLLFMRYPFTAIPRLGLAMDAAWLVVLWLWWGRLSRLQGLLAGAAACSPPVMLALERCNSDLIIFILIAAALGCLARGWPGPAWLGLFVAAVLKLFPVVAFAVFFQRGWRQARGWLWAAAGGLGAWTLLNLGEIRAIAHNTPTGGPAISYGSAVVFTIADLLHQERTGSWAGYSAVAWLGAVAAALLAGLAGWAGFRRRSSSVPSPSFDRTLAGFHAGACVYVATFILGSNFAYRQIFLLLCLPWLLRRQDGWNLGRRRIAAASGLFLLLWSNPQWWLPLIAVREAASWGLLVLLACLVGATLLPRESTIRTSNS